MVTYAKNLTKIGELHVWWRNGHIHKNLTKNGEEKKKKKKTGRKSQNWKHLCGYQILSKVVVTLFEKKTVKKRNNKYLAEKKPKPL